jgi:hypothetical protein
MNLSLINPAFKQVTKCASEAQQNQSASVLNDEDHSREARPRRKIDLAKLQQADCHLFECRVNNAKSSLFAPFYASSKAASWSTYPSMSYEAALKSAKKTIKNQNFLH